jgi:hypothetical protein
VSERRRPTAEELFAAGRAEKPSAAARQRALRALGVSGAAPVTCNDASSPEGGTTKRPRGATRRRVRRDHLAVAAALVAIAAATAVVVRRDADEALPIASEPRADMPVTAPTASAVDEAPAPSNEPAGEPAPVAPETGPSTSARARASASASAVPMSLGDEVAALDGARRALSAGDANAALVALDAYQRAARRPRLGNEATLLRIEALLRAGRRSEAIVLAQSFADRNPTSPLADRARALTATDPPTPAPGGTAP